MGLFVWRARTHTHIHRSRSKGLKQLRKLLLDNGRVAGHICVASRRQLLGKRQNKPTAAVTGMGAVTHAHTPMVVVVDLTQIPTNAPNGRGRQDTQTAGL